MNRLAVAAVALVLALWLAAAARSTEPSPPAAPNVCAAVDPDECRTFCVAQADPLEAFVAIVDPTFGDVLAIVRCDVAFPGQEVGQ